MTFKKRPKSAFDLILVMDCETSGLNMNTSNPPRNYDTGEHYQAVSWGLLVVDANTLEIKDSKYLEVQWNGVSTWSEEAERVHGLSREYLAQHGISEEDAAVEIAELILKHWGPDGVVICGGHNVGTFDVPFLRDLMQKYEIPIRFAHRHVDTFSTGFTTLRAYDSDQLFEMVGCDARGAHNALEDAKNSLQAIRVIRAIFDQAL